MPASRRSRRRSPVSAIAAAGVVAVGCSLLLAPPATAAVVTEPISYSAQDAALGLSVLGSYETGIFDQSAAEIVAYYDDRVFTVNAQAGAVDVLDVSDPTAPEKLYSITGDGIANSIAIRADGLGVIALESAPKTDAGSLVFFDANSATADAVLGEVTVGALPDMVTISADGRFAVVANEGEPSDDFTVDPEGSVGVVSLPTALSAPTQDAVAIADFHEFEAGGSLTLDPGVRVFGPTPEAGNPVSRNLEPEYVAIDGGTAYAALQEANAVAEIDLATATVTDIVPLGFTDRGTTGNGLDASDRDPRDAPTINIETYPGLHGVYMPDSISTYRSNGTTYLVTANEGDSREWGDFIDAARVKDLGDDLPPVCDTSSLAGLTGDADLGRLTIITDLGLSESGDCYDELYAFGGRSFSVWTTDGDLVYDSGDSLEQITAAANPAFFNSNHSESNAEGRSDDKGPEPENLTIGTVDGRTYAFIGLERVGGVAVYDITDPAAPTFVTYLNNRNFAESVEDGGDLASAGDLGPEGLAFIPATTSPTGTPMLAVGNEVSGTTTLFSIDVLGGDTTTLQVLGINDFHGRIEQNLGNGEAGAAVLAGAVDALTAENPNTVFVSAGDNIGASTFTSFSQQDAPTIEALVASGLSVSAVGNHEFDGGFADLTDRVIPAYGGSEFALGANVYLTGTTTPALDEFALKTVDGVTIGFIGTVTEQTASMVSPAGIADIEFGDQLEAANRVAGQLQDGDETNGEADVLVLLTHDGADVADCDTIATGTSDYAQLVRGASGNIDAILSGHTHQEYACSYPVDGWADGIERPVVQAGQYGTNLDRLTIEVDPADHTVVSLSADLLPLVIDGSAAYAADPTVAAIVAEATAEAEVVGATPVGAISADILRGGTAGSDRGVESSLGNLIADIQLWATSHDGFGGEPAQIALMNPGGLRDDLLYGTDGVVTYKEAAAVQPFANTLWTVELTGAQLADVLEEQWQPDGSSRPKLHLGTSEGFSYTYDPDAARGSHILSMTYKGKTIAADDVYRVATNSFLVSGGDNFTTFADGANATDTGQADLAATVSYFEAHDLVDPAPLGRAVVAGTDWATVTLDSASVEQGGSVNVTVTGLEDGQQIDATLFSEPIVVAGIPAADASGTVRFTVEVPADFDVGVHTLAVSSVGLEPITTAVTVLAAPGSPAGSPADDLAATGANVGLLAVLGILLTLAGAGLLRRRPLLLAAANSRPTV
ncbi:2',3'-cyclic-nucleotide 2'-phosphodiesterase (5'-nucleotidase family) [Mycetocola sp. CAN_C7]|uniref:choice-of-anchor I family protein n=1 Tax=Mycetocola sp. CAN_C7 TaxID=2787724 RepID=UPI0018CB40B1